MPQRRPGPRKKREANMSKLADQLIQWRAPGGLFHSDLDHYRLQDHDFTDSRPLRTAEHFGCVVHQRSSATGGDCHVRFAWLLALGRLTVVAFFAIFVFSSPAPSIRKAGGCNEALAIALAHRQRDQLCQHGDGFAGRRDRSASAACHGIVAAVGNSDRAAGRTSGQTAFRYGYRCRRIYLFSNPSSSTIAEASLTAWLAAGTPQ